MKSTGYLGQCRPIWNDQGSFSNRSGYFYQTSNERHYETQLGDVSFLFWNAGGLVPNDFHPPETPDWTSTRDSGHYLGIDCHAHCCSDFLARSLRPKIFSWLCGERNAYRIHVHCQRLLHAARASAPAKLVVFLDWSLDHHWGCLELWLRPNHRRVFGTVAVHLSTRRLAHHSLWVVGFRSAQFCGISVVSILRRASSRS